MRVRSKYQNAVNLEAWTILARVRNTHAFFGTHPTIDELVDSATSVERADLTPTELAARISLIILERAISNVTRQIRLSIIEILHEDKEDNFQAYSPAGRSMCNAADWINIPELTPILGFAMNYLCLQERRGKLSTLNKTHFFADVASLLLGKPLDVGSFRR